MFGLKKTVVAALCAASMMVGTIAPAAAANEAFTAAEEAIAASAVYAIEEAEKEAEKESGFFTVPAEEAAKGDIAVESSLEAVSEDNDEEDDDAQAAVVADNDNPSTATSDDVQPSSSETPESSTPEETSSTDEPKLDEVEGFVDWFYECFLGRHAEPAGLASWTSYLKSKQSTGAQVAAGIMFSDEGFGKNLSDAEFVAALYKSILRRDPKDDEVKTWTGVLDRAYTRKKVVEGFLNSDEFALTCEAINILPGRFDSNEIADVHHPVAEFVSRLYQVCLGRKYDQDGLNAWTDALVNRGSTGADVVWGFLASEEYKGRNRSDADYIEDLYNTFLGRPSDPAGKESWIKVAATGFSRKYLAQGFVGSDEFALFCKTAGIKAGKLEMEELRDIYGGITELINGLYKIVLRRENVSGEDINYWINKALSDKNIIDVIHGFFFSNEYKDRKTTNSRFVKDVYRSVLFRDVEENVLTARVRELDNGTSRDAILQSIIGSEEFRIICQNKGIPLFFDGWYDGRYYVNGKTFTGWKTIDGYKRYYQDGVLLTDLDSVLGNTKNYVLMVNRTTCTITAYAYNSSTKKYDIPAKVALCTTGADATPTGSGTFYISDQYRWKELMGPCWGQWSSRFNGGQLFHSIMYNVSGDNTTMSVGAFNHLGNRGSHGCCRLPAYMAYWIYNHCSRGTKVVIYDSKDPGPLGKPANIILPSWHTWDPTDPTAVKYCQERGCH